MKKSEILEVLGNYVTNYYVKEIRDKYWLIVEAKTLTAYHIAMLDRFILSIEPTDNKSLRIHFCSMVNIND